MILAYYFSLMIAGQDYPVLAGPYEDWGACESVRDYLDQHGYETDGCGLMPFPQEDAVLLEVVSIP